MNENEREKQTQRSSMENEYSSQWRSTINFSGGGQQSVKLYYAVHASRLSTVKTLQLVIYIAGLRIEGRPVREEGGGRPLPPPTNNHLLLPPPPMDTLRSHGKAHERPVPYWPLLT